MRIWNLEGELFGLFIDLRRIGPSITENMCAYKKVVIHYKKMWIYYQLLHKTIVRYFRKSGFMKKIFIITENM